MRDFTKIIFTSLAFVFFGFQANCQNNWTQKANYGGGFISGAFYFSIGNKGYAGLGNFWQYDPVLDVWTQIASFPGASNRFFGINFSVGGKGYVGLGNNSNMLNDIWQYDPISNSWTQMGNFPPGGRTAALGFSVGNKGYVFSGYNNSTEFNDLWEYDPTNDTWTQKTSFPGVGREFCVGFGIGNKGYAGFGESQGNSVSGFAEFDPVTNTWTTKSSCCPWSTYDHVTFSAGCFGYFGTGQFVTGGGGLLQDFYQYDPSADTWTQEANFGGVGREAAFGFGIGGYAYIGGGQACCGTGGMVTDFWQYTPTAITNCDVYGCQIQLSDTTICVGNNVVLRDSLYSYSSLTSQPSYLWSTGDTIASIIVSPQQTTVYSVTVSYGSFICADTVTVFVTTTPPSGLGSITGITTACLNGIQTYIVGSASGSTIYNWNIDSAGVILSGQGTDTIRVQCDTSGTFPIAVTASNACGNSTAATINVTVLDTISLTVSPISGIDTVCTGNASYTIQPNNIATNYTWTVSNGGTITSGQGTTGINVNWNGTGQQTVSVIASNACASSSSVSQTIFINPSPTSPTVIVQNDTICQGDSTLISGSNSIGGTISYNFYSASIGGNLIGASPQKVSPNVTTTYYLEAINQYGCIDSAGRIPATVYVNSAPVILGVNATNDTICYGSATTLIANASPTGAIITWWDSSLAGNLLTTGDTFSTGILTNNTSYYVQATSSNGCKSLQGRVPAMVNVNTALLILSISSANDTVCYGSATRFIANTSSAGAIVSWWDSLAGGNFLATGDTFQTPSLTHTISYFAHVASSNGCNGLQGRIVATVFVEPQTAIILTSDKLNNVILPQEAITFTASPNGFSNYAFFVNSVSVQSGSSNIFSTNSLINNDTVSVIATDNGCESLKSEIIVTVGNFPNAFTPNGDGINDVFLKGYNLTVLNRWGQELYSGLNGWDGTYNGQRVSSGTYFYIVNLSNKTIRSAVTVVIQ